ncbi:DNA-directed RNA polymerase [Salvia divinorum]|uniref:DNA-directed RNA polymerase n=1 Tax=Salvia divinorum TaxID=28513 RepID=A0ABD1IF17_SALDI
MAVAPSFHCICTPSFSYSSSKPIAMQRSCLVILFVQSLLICVVSGFEFEDQKNFFYTDPSTSTPPSISYTPPVTFAPSRGGTPPANSGSPPANRGHHTSSPSSPGRGYYHTPPRSTSGPPSTVTPGVAVPSPPSDPTSPPYTCTYWKKHPSVIWGLLGWWGSVGNAFGVSNVPGMGAKMNLLQALSNMRTDGYGEICRQGTAALLNSMIDAKFPYTSAQVRDAFAAALASSNAAAAQARLFKLANEGKTYPTS